VRRTLLLAVCVLVTACGSGDQRLSRTAFVHRADAVCARYNGQTTALGTPTSIRRLADVAGTTLPLLERTRAALGSLRPPKTDDDLAHRWLDAIDRVRVDVGKIRDAARKQDLDGLRALLPAARRDNSEVNRLASQLGLSICSKDG
jgi:hypothetical protein